MDKIIISIICLFKHYLMRFLYHLVIFLFFCTNVNKVYASGFFSFLIECISNPCNCGYGTRKEKWNDKEYDKGDENFLCPPYNRTQGRDDNTCIVQSSYPGNFILSHIYYCAEHTKESSYFDPKINVRYQSCNAAACFSDSTTLSWDGECVIWPTGYGIPLLRICARIAFPKDIETDTPADMGYSEGYHLDEQGALVRDKDILDDEGKKVKFNAPKLCAYYDPSFLDTTKVNLYPLLPPDLFDTNLLSQPMHKTDKTHPIIRALLFVVNTAGDAQRAVGSLLDNLTNSANGESGTDVMGSIVKSLSGVFTSGFTADLIASVLEEIGSVNRHVDSCLGCVELPFGPYPPPFCSELNKSPPMLVTQKICGKDKNGNHFASTDPNNGCVVSSLDNDFIINSVRVGYEELFPICSNGESPLTSDKCVTILGGENLSASAMHIMTGKKDIIKSCSMNSSGSSCVQSKINYQCRVSSNGCNQGWRIVYATKIGSSITPNKYYFDNIPDCNAVGGDYGVCQIVWGVNMAEFVDIPLEIAVNSVLSQGQQYNLYDKYNNLNSVKAYIKSERNAIGISSDFPYDPKKICVINTTQNLLVGCEHRIEDYKINAIDLCAPPFSCDSVEDILAPKIGVKLSTPRHSRQVDLTVYSFTNDQESRSEINIGGIKIKAFATNDEFLRPPFSGYYAFNPAVIFGVYTNGFPVNKDGTESKNTYYLYGFEHVNSKYIRGGSKVCIDLPNSGKCSNKNPENCVLTKISRADIVDCREFFELEKQFGSFKRCSANEKLICSESNIIHYKSDPKKYISIRKCSDTDYCYDYANDLCVIDSNLSNRHDPSPEQGQKLDDDQFYDINRQSNIDFLRNNSDKYAVRDKSFIERGLCFDIPKLKCPAVSSKDASLLEIKGMESIAETMLYDEAIPVCKKGYVPSGDIGHFCTINLELKTILFVPVDNNAKCIKE